MSMQTDGVGRVLASDRGLPWGLPWGLPRTLQGVLQGGAAGLPELLERLGVNVQVTRSMDRSEIGSASVDLFYSDSVLQFMEPRDLTTLVRQALRFLKPSGVSFHVIDCSDLHAANDRRIPRLAYLTYPDALWKLLTSRYLNYQNRLRMPQFAELFDREGLASEVVSPVLSPEDVEFTSRHLARDGHHPLEVGDQA